MLFTVDLRSKMPPIKDQGRRETCLAFAITGAHETERGKASQLLDLSEETIYWKGRLLSGLAKGMKYEAANQALRSQGQPEEKYWAYDSNRDDTASEYVPPPDAINPANCFQGMLDKIDLKVETIKAALDQMRTVVAGVKMSYPFYRPLKGFIQMPTPSEMIAQGHAIVLVGYGDSPTQAQDGHFIIRNSWGATWGENGYGYLPYKYLSDHATGAFVLELN